MQNNESVSLPEDFRGVHIHFVGIKGTGMAALVEILFHKGAVITGSDVSERFYTDEVLEHLGLSALPFGAANITDDVQFVIYSSAYKLDKNPDLRYMYDENDDNTSVLYFESGRAVISSFTEEPKIIDF